MDAGTQLLSPADKNAILSRAVYEWIKEHIDRSETLDGVPQQDIDFGQVRAIFGSRLFLKVEEAYPTLVLGDTLELVLMNAMTDILENIAQWHSFITVDDDIDARISTIERSFNADLLDCWRTYNTRIALKYPFTTIIQSSGFGKSRLLYEFALNMQNNEPMRVLYTCMRQNAVSTGFPKTTTELNAFFFSENCTVESITQRLYAAFEYAMAHWETVGIEWLGLFSRLSMKRIASGGQSKHLEGKSLSNAFGSNVTTVFPSDDDPNISRRLSINAVKKKAKMVKIGAKTTQERAQDTSTSPRSGDSSQCDVKPNEGIPASGTSSHVIMNDTQKPSMRILIFVIDEASALINDNPTDDETKPSKHRLLRHALKRVNEDPEHIWTQFRHLCGPGGLKLKDI